MEDKTKITVSDETREWVENYKKRKDELRQKRLAKKEKKPAERKWPYWSNE